jgi:hypothetical protein
LETVSVEDGGSGLVATDRGETQRYLDGRNDDATYEAWSESAARDACAAVGVRFRQPPDSYAVIEADIEDAPSLAVQAVSRAIDGFFNAHMRPDLRPS